MGNGGPAAASASIAVLAGGAVLGGVFAAARTMAGLHPVSVAAGLTLYVLAGAIVVTRVGRFHHLARFGLANILTLIRLVIACLCAAAAVEAGLTPLEEQAMWAMFSLAVVALVIDGLDGFAARRLDLASAFGARFDMEVDAFLILVLSVIAAELGKAGAWVIAGGLLRYGYVAAAVVLPALNRPLAPAWRRKAIAVIQGAALAALLMPVIQPPLSVVIAAGALALLVYSFSVDVLAQVRGS